MESTASDLAKLAKADIVAQRRRLRRLGGKAQLDKKRQTIVNAGDLMGVTATDEHEHSHDHAEGEEGRHHHHGATNPHLWFSPEAVLKAAEAINAVYADKAGPVLPPPPPCNVTSTTGRNPQGNGQLAHVLPGIHEQGGSGHRDAGPLIRHRPRQPCAKFPAYRCVPSARGDSHIISTTIMRTVLI